MTLLTLVASTDENLKGMEIFPTGAIWEEMITQGQWNVLGPLRAGRGPPDLKTCNHILAEVKKQHPDLVILEPPVGPWSTWEKSSKDDVRRIKEKYLPLWWLVHNCGSFRRIRGGLCS